MPERLTSNRKVIGTKQLRKALKAGRVRTAYVAADARLFKALAVFLDDSVGQLRSALRAVAPG